MRTLNKIATGQRGGNGADRKSDATGRCPSWVHFYTGWGMLKSTRMTQSGHSRSRGEPSCRRPDRQLRAGLHYSRWSKGQMDNSDAVIIGAGPAGLASAACMGALGLDATVLEKADTVGSVWRRHYDRLHQHTDRGHSCLPGKALVGPGLFCSGVELPVQKLAHRRKGIRGNFDEIGAGRRERPKRSSILTSRPLLPAIGRRQA
jgi:hypothetical protein